MVQVGRLIAARLFQAVTVALLVGSLCFALMWTLPGDIALRIAAARYGPDLLSNAAAEKVRADLGLDRPFFVQFFEWLGDVVRFDLGTSLVTGQRILHELEVQLGYTLLLSFFALALSILIGPILGAAAGVRQASIYDRLLLVASAAVRALPAFVLALLLMLVFSLALGWFPPAGFGTWRELILPGLTLALGLAALSARVTRDSVAAVVETPYYRHARTKRLPGWVLPWRHATRNAAIPVVSYLGLQLVYLIEGVMVVESIFSYPGIGHALVHAVVARDIPMVQGTALTMGLLFVLLNALIDVACVAIDPRQRIVPRPTGLRGGTGSA